MPASVPTRYANEIVVREAPPSVERHFSTIYMPINDAIAWENDPAWGLYDKDGRLIEAAAYCRGPGKHTVGQSWQQDLSHVELETAPPGDYIYGGNLIAHYGHFLISCLSRFWIGIKMDLSRYKVICHGAGTPDGWWSHGNVREILSSIGLSQSNFVVFKRPTLIPEIQIPRPSAEEHNFVHKIYADWGHTVGRALLRSKNLTVSDKPVWLAKTHLRQGVQGLLNEEDLITILQAGGVEIVHPQELSVADQVALFATRPAIMGTAGSAFHTSILWPPRAKLVCLNIYDNINSNFAIADLANSNNVIYLHGVAEQTVRDPATRFDAPFVLKDIIEVSRTILHICGLTRG